MYSAGRRSARGLVSNRILAVLSVWWGSPVGVPVGGRGVLRNEKQKNFRFIASKMPGLPRPAKIKAVGSTYGDAGGGGVIFKGRPPFRRSAPCEEDEGVDAPSLCQPCLTVHADIIAQSEVLWSPLLSFSLELCPSHCVRVGMVWCVVRGPAPCALAPGCLALCCPVLPCPLCSPCVHTLGPWLCALGSLALWNSWPLARGV